MSRSTQHELQPRTDHDGMSRRLSVLACKRAIRGTLQSDLQSEFESRGKYADQTESYRRWAYVNRASQDRMWSLLAEQVDADYGRIEDSAAADNPPGSLALQEHASIPEYQFEANIHGQPGGYMLERGDSDLAAGILYEAGGNIYAMGQGIGRRDSKGERLIAHIRESHPEFHPKRILEMGCSAGGQSCDYPEAFPEAEFHAVDLSPAMLRFAHARAAKLCAKVHFRQADAAHTGYPDGHFDLVISHNMFHEVAAGHMPAIMRESHRLLAPGGFCIHQDVPIQMERLDDWMQFVSGWQKDHNDEPFWLDYANADLPALMRDAGFDENQIRADYIPALDGPIPWYVVSARR